MGLTELLQRLSEDKEFENKFKELDSVDAFVEQAEKEGFSISENDVEALRLEVQYRESGSAELPDDQLESIAGGFSLGKFLDGNNSFLSWIVSLFEGRNNNTNASSGAGVNNLLYKSEPVRVVTLQHNSKNPASVVNLPHNSKNRQNVVPTLDEMRFTSDDTGFI
jgi:predicted ribosomally synthesized peptide with nif11-like leader